MKKVYKVFRLVTADPMADVKDRGGSFGRLFPAVSSLIPMQDGYFESIEEAEAAMPSGDDDERLKGIEALILPVYVL